VLLPLADRIETITYDNGKEFASHVEIATSLGKPGLRSTRRSRTEPRETSPRSWITYRALGTAIHRDLNAVVIAHDVPTYHPSAPKSESVQWA
jgi:hypothetical protein